MKQKELLNRLKTEVQWCEVGGNSTILGFCNLLRTLFFKDEVYLYDTLHKYKPKATFKHTTLYWFNPGDWKIRLSFLEEVIKVELNPFYKLAYKLGLYKFKY